MLNLFAILLPNWNCMTEKLRLSAEKLMQHRAQCCGEVVLVLIVFEKEVADGDLVSVFEFMVN
jgi:hypothetical protein